MEARKSLINPFPEGGETEFSYSMEFCSSSSWEFCSIFRWQHTLSIIQLVAMGDSVDKLLGKHKAHNRSKQLIALCNWQAHKTLWLLFAEKKHQDLRLCQY